MKLEKNFILKKITFWILIIIIVSAGFFIYKKKFSPVEVKGVVVKRQDLETSVTGTSTGIIKSEVEVSVTSQRTGMIIALYFDEGDRVKPGDLIAKLELSEVVTNLKKAGSDLRQVEVNLENIKTEYERKKALYEENLLTKQQFDDVQARMQVAVAAVKSAKATRDVFQLQYDYSFIKTPVAGIVAERPVDVGDTVLTGQKIASVVDPDMLYISVPVDEADVGSIALGQDARITFDAYSGKVFHGRVTRISPIVTGAKQETRTFEVRVSSPEEEIVLKPGMSADVEIITGIAKDVLVIPSQAVIDMRIEQFVYVDEGGRAKKKKVGIGMYNWNFSEIREGLKEGEAVIFTPDIPGFKEGMRVKVVNPS